tara:strand:+ start:16630 stop:16923 length:294 start_codon:yes stop_codon:yes gene_type:complete
MKEKSERKLHSVATWSWIVLRWTAIFLYYTLFIVAIGAATACLVFLTLGKLYYPEGSYRDLALSGLKVGTILSGIWGIGVAIVKCFVKGKAERDARL